MKQIMIVMVLLTSITGKLCAQLTLNKPSMSIEDMKHFNRRYFVDLKVGNTLVMDVYGRSAAPYITNIDSLVTELKTAINIVKDSIGPEWMTRTVTVSMYNNAAKEIVWSSELPAEKHLMLYDKKRTMMKTAQDTVVLNVFAILPAADNNDVPFLRLMFYLNSVEDVFDISTNQFTDLFASLTPYDRKAWASSSEGFSYFKSNPRIQMRKAYDPETPRISFAADISMSAQNYKDHFVPSINTGIGRVNEQNYIEEQVWLGHEFHFAFGRATGGAMKTFVNQFLTLGYKTRNLDPNSRILGVFPNLKLGYLIKRSGELFDKHTWKLGVGQFYVGKSTLRIEPTIYFTKLFKGVTPSLRITQSLGKKN